MKMLVRQTAKQLAGAFFENEDSFNDGRVMRTRRFRDEMKNQQAFVNEYWRDFVVPAKKVLSHMLMQPGTPQHEKDAIYDALLQSRGALTDEQLVAPSIIRMN